MGSGYFHVGVKTSTHLYISYISLQLKGWNMESTAGEKEDSRFAKVNLQFSGSSFSMSGLQAMNESKLVLLGCFNWSENMSELDRITTRHLNSFSAGWILKYTPRIGHVTPQTRQQTRISLKFVGLRSEVWGLRMRMRMRMMMMMMMMPLWYPKGSC